MLVSLKPFILELQAFAALVASASLQVCVRVCE